MTLLYAAFLLLGAPGDPAATPATPPAQETPVPQAGKDGHDAASAIKVKSVAEEYEILRRLGLRPKMQSLMMIKDHPYDMLRVVDPRTGEERDIWFDIKSFFGKEFNF